MSAPLHTHWIRRHRKLPGPLHSAHLPLGSAQSHGPSHAGTCRGDHGSLGESPRSARKEILRWRLARRASLRQCPWSPHLRKGWLCEGFYGTDTFRAVLSWGKRARPLYPCIGTGTGLDCPGKGCGHEWGHSARAIPERTEPYRLRAGSWGISVARGLGASSQNPHGERDSLFQENISAQMTFESSLIILALITGLTCEPYQSSLLAIPLSLGIKYILRP